MLALRGPRLRRGVCPTIIALLLAGIKMRTPTSALIALPALAMLLAAVFAAGEGGTDLGKVENFDKAIEWPVSGSLHSKPDACIALD